jgi:hypothetical protein
MYPHPIVCRFTVLPDRKTIDRYRDVGSIHLVHAFGSDRVLLYLLSKIREWGVRRLSIIGCMLNRTHMEAIALGIRSGHLRSLHLEDTDASPGDMECIYHALTCSRLTELKLKGTSCIDLVCLFDTIMRVRTRLRRLHVEARALTTEEMEALCRMLPRSRLREFSLWGVPIPATQFRVLCRQLARCPRLSIVNLGHGGLSIEHVKDLVDWMSAHPLKYLGLDSNKLTDKAILSLAEGIRRCPTLVHCDVRYNPCRSVRPFIWAVSGHPRLRVLDIAGTCVSTDDRLKLHKALCHQRAKSTRVMLMLVAFISRHSTTHTFMPADVLRELAQFLFEI